MAFSGRIAIKPGRGDSSQIVLLIRHPMETGFRKDKKTGETIPAHFVQTVDVSIDGKIVIRAKMGTAVSRNPFLLMATSKLATGTKISVNWQDNKAESGKFETIVS